MDARKLLCILLFAQMTIVAYASLAVRVGAKLVGNQGFDTSRITAVPVVIARDYWFVAWVVLAVLFAVFLWSIIRNGRTGVSRSRRS